MTRGHRDSLRLRCRAFSSPSPCRFIPALSNNHQIQRIQLEAAARKVNVAIVCDFVHVIEYLWKAAWSFHREGDPAAEAWVRRHAKTILQGGAKRVAATIRRAATNAALPPGQRAGADTCARYLTT